MSSFTLHPQLEADSVFISDLQLSQLRLQNQKTVPWLVLVPRRIEIELYRLNAGDRGLLMDEIVLASKLLEMLYKPDKINVATLGNVVPQMHVHIVGRYKDDPAWPKPVWGNLPPAPYEPEELTAIQKRLNDAINSQK
jgi:diadenosine tetraphosphate (Ap4A) HIT family hydrolase